MKKSLLALGVSLLALTSTVLAEAIIPVKRVYNDLDKYWTSSTEFDVSHISQWESPTGLIKTYRGVYVSVSAHSDESFVRFRLTPKSQVELKKVNSSLFRSTGACDSNSTVKDVRVFADSKELQWTDFSLDFTEQRAFGDKESAHVERNYAVIRVTLARKDYLELSKASDIKFVICGNTYDLSWAQRGALHTLGTYLIP